MNFKRGMLVFFIILVLSLTAVSASELDHSTQSDSSLDDSLLVADSGIDSSGDSLVVADSETDSSDDTLDSGDHDSDLPYIDSSIDDGEDIQDDIDGEESHPVETDEGENISIDDGDNSQSIDNDNANEPVVGNEMENSNSFNNDSTALSSSNIHLMDASKYPKSNLDSFHIQPKSNHLVKTISYPQSDLNLELLFILFIPALIGFAYIKVQ